MKPLLINLIKAVIWGAVCIFAIPLACASAATPLDTPASKAAPVVSKPQMSLPGVKEHLKLKHLFSPKRGKNLRLNTDWQGLT
jgi:hypothetical protein